jgi:hypothetical protein
MAWELGGVLYGVGGGTLYKVNPANGTLTTVGSGGANFQAFGSTTSGLFGLDNSMNLYSVDPTTGAASFIGSTGIARPFHDGLSAGGSTLYFTAEPNQFTGPSILYSLDTISGASTLIGSVSSTSAIFGPVIVNGKVYAASCGTGDDSCGFNPSAESIYTLNPATGGPTFVAVSAATRIPDGMAPIVPLYDVCVFYDPTKAIKSGATIPIKLELCDGSGNDLSASSIIVHAVSITQTSTSINGAVEDPGNANPDSDFRFDASLGTTGGYIFNLKTTGVTTGTYNLSFTVTGDSFVYTTPFQVK